MSIVTRFVEWLRIVSFQEYSLQHFILLSIGAKKPGAINLQIYSWSPHLIRRNSIGSLGEWSSDLRLLQLLCRATWKSLIQNRENTLSFCTLVTLTWHSRMQLQCLTCQLSYKKQLPSQTKPLLSSAQTLVYLSLASPLHPHRSFIAPSFFYVSRRRPRLWPGRSSQGSPRCRSLSPGIREGCWEFQPLFLSISS